VTRTTNRRAADFNAAHEVISIHLPVRDTAKSALAPVLPDVDLAKKVVTWLERHRPTKFTVRENVGLGVPAGQPLASCSRGP
jgi:hypothetical protein